jgi:hypothetical protein
MKATTPRIHLIRDHAFCLMDFHAKGSHLERELRSAYEAMSSLAKALRVELSVPMMQKSPTEPQVGTCDDIKRQKRTQNAPV